MPTLPASPKPTTRPSCQRGLGHLDARWRRFRPKRSRPAGVDLDRLHVAQIEHQSALGGRVRRHPNVRPNGSRIRRRCRARHSPRAARRRPISAARWRPGRCRTAVHHDAGRVIGGIRGAISVPEKPVLRAAMAVSILVISSSFTWSYATMTNGGVRNRQLDPQKSRAQRRAGGRCRRRTILAINQGGNRQPGRAP